MGTASELENTYRQAVRPSIDGNGEADMATDSVASDSGRALQRWRGVTKRPNIGTNTNAKVEQLLALDVVVGDADASIATIVLAVDHVDGTEADIVRGGDDGVASNGATGRTEDDNTAISRAIDLSRRG